MWIFLSLNMLIPWTLNRQYFVQEQCSISISMQPGVHYCIFDIIEGILRVSTDPNMKM